MPGFKICGKGDGPNHVSEVRRKHRWLFKTFENMVTPQVLLVLKAATRPQFDLEQPEMHHNQEVIYYAGKQKWEPCKLSWYDVEQDPDVSKAIYEWLQKFINLDTANVEVPNTYKKLAELSMVNGQGESKETWKMCGAWPASINWGDLDYSNTELQMIEVTIRYDRATREAT
jgi:hypothetical protein